MRGSALWRVRPYVKPYLGQMAFVGITALVGLAAATILPLVIKAVIDGPITRGDRGGILPLALFSLGLGFVETFLACLRRYSLAYVAMGIETDLRNDLYGHLQKLPVSFHDEWQSGQLLSRAITDIAVIRRFMGFGIIFLLINGVTFSMVAFVLIRLNWLLAVLTLVGVLPCIELVRRFERSYSDVSRRIQDQQGDLTTTIEESATGIRAIKAFGRRRLVGTRFAHEARLLYDSGMDGVRLRGHFEALLVLIPRLGLGVILLGGAISVSHGSLSLGGLVAFTSYLLLLVWPVEALGWIIAMAQEASTAATRIYEVFDAPLEITDRAGAATVIDVTGRVCFDDVSFSYPGQDDLVLRHVDLDVAPGETVALVGMTGSGKTTLVSLVPRLYDVTSGRITLDGHDLRDLTVDSLRQHVTVAFEDPTLFSASVRDNLMLGAPWATEGDVEAALRVAQAEFAFDLPWGLETRIGEQGLSLSGGQRQRLALARAIIGRPRVLVLDDPLSALDVHTEALVEEALVRVLEGVTALVVVHRPSTVALADRVALVHDGTIAAVATHSELMEGDERYRAILSQEAEHIDEEAVA